MSKNKRLTIVVVSLLLAVLSITCGIIYTNAKYTSSVSGNFSASVAKWSFDLSGTDSYSSADTIQNLVIADTCNAETLVNGKIAPGTSGSFDIVVDATDSEVGVNYTVSFASADAGKTLPTNLVFELDGSALSLTDGISGTIDANATNKTITHHVTWTWAYETTNGDIADTQDGCAGLDYAFTVTAVGTQVQPQ